MPPFWNNPPILPTSRFLWKKIWIPYFLWKFRKIPWKTASPLPLYKVVVGGFNYDYSIAYYCNKGKSLKTWKRRINLGIWEAWYRLASGNIITDTEISCHCRTYIYMLLHYRWSLSEYAVIRFDIWKASMYVLKNIYIFLFIIIYINSYMFRSYTEMVFFLMRYLRRSANFLLLKTILATLNEEIELWNQFSVKHFYQN